MVRFVRMSRTSQSAEEEREGTLHDLRSSTTPPTDRGHGPYPFILKDLLRAGAFGPGVLDRADEVGFSVAHRAGDRDELPCQR